MKTLVKNAQIITPIRILEKAGLYIEDGIIKKIIVNGEESNINADKIIDANGKYLAPGFIDIHTHGGGNYDFMDGMVEDFINAAKTHLEYGTTTIVPTTTTSTLDKLFETLDNFDIAKNNIDDGPNLLGLHLEGPYFSLEQKGAQDPRFIKNPDREEYIKILNYSDNIVRWSVAPELDGALEMAEELTKRNILCSVAHSNANYDQVAKAFERGFSHVTHLYSGMSSVHRINAFRHAGVVESAYLIDEMTVEIIADGVHLPASLLELVYKIKGADKICLVTDSMRGAGMPEGEYVLGNKESNFRVLVEDGVAKLPDRTAFAGSVATADRLIKTMVDMAHVPLHEAVKMLTYTPARIMGIEQKKGSIVEGKDADIVLFDEKINISMVMINGKILKG